MNKKLDKLKKEFAVIKRGLETVKKLQPWLLTLTIIRAVFNALSPFINIYMSGVILNELAGMRDLKKLTLFVILTVGLNLFVSLTLHGINKFIELKNQLFNYNYEMTLSGKILTMDYENVENFDVHMKRQQITERDNWGRGGLKSIPGMFEDVIKNLFQIIFSIALTYKMFIMFADHTDNKLLSIVNTPLFSFFILIMLVGSILFSIFINTAFARKEVELSDGFAPLNRILGYYINEYFSNYSAGKDIRMYNQKNFLMNEVMAFLGDSTVFRKIFYAQTAYKIPDDFISAAVTFLTYIFVALKSLSGLFGVGDIVRYVGSITQFTSSFSGFMWQFTNLRLRTDTLQLYFDFIDMPDKKYQGTIPVEKRDDNEYEIEFKNVSFKYPSTETYALKNVSMKFRVGERMAVVGMNGSGKTTMIKLLCRLYDPTEGEITLNGVDIKKYDYNEYLSIFSVVFQDFNLFSFSLGQNIATSVEYDEDMIKECIGEAGFGERFASMQDGVETPLYKDFDENGVEISGGEAQKIALARALYKNAPFIVLDEPTSALDPIAEYDIYSKFNEIVGDKTAIYISHRLSSCRFCDDIAVFNEGELIQRGNHDTLLADESGKYYELWNAQAQYYNKSVY